MDLPEGHVPIEICVNDQADWELIYRHPEIHVKCLVPGCNTLLTPKRMSRSGLRFLAVRSGGCSHNLVEMPLEPDEVEQDASTVPNGGGPEGREHLWVKGRLYKIARRLGVDAVVEHSITRADVFLPNSGLILEYQRWDTDFPARTTSRTIKGAASTLWMFPWQPDSPRTARLTAFNNEVFQNGALYLAVRSIKDFNEHQRPWDNPSQERTARLFASGSVAKFDPARGRLVRTEMSLAKVLAEIIEQKRVLARAPVYSRRSGRTSPSLVWVLEDDLAQANSKQNRRQHAEVRTPAVRDPRVSQGTGLQSQPPARRDTSKPASVPPQKDRGVLTEPEPTAAAPAKSSYVPSVPTRKPAPMVTGASTYRPTRLHRPTWWARIRDWFN